MIEYRFLLVSLSIEAILGETTIHRRKEKLKQMSSGQGVGDVYAATLERIRAQNVGRARLGMEAIMWVAHSERPLKPDELCQALGVEIGSRDLNHDDVPSIRMILSCGLGLVTVDSSSCRVRLVHFTLQEYILANPTLFQSPHSMIAEVCLTFLNFAYIRGLSPTLSAPPPTAPFLEYASCHWGAHARREINESAIPLALKLLDRFDAHISCKLLLLREPVWRRPFDSQGNPVGFTGLHGGVSLGVLELMISLFDMEKWDLNATNLHGSTALAWAAGSLKYHARDVKILLEQEGVSPNIADNEGRTPLSLASEFGLGGIVKILLERNDIDPDIPDEKGQTPFSWAAMYGYAQVVEMLVERNDVNPDVVDKGGRTPLSWAAGYREAETVGILLKRNDVNPDRADEKGRTPLSWAAGYGNEEIVRLLLERNDVNPNVADESGRTPLSWAASCGEEETVHLLLERNDINPDAADQNGRTPLSWAAETCMENIVEILLERNDVNPDAADESGRTPLSWAAVGWVDEPENNLDTEGRNYNDDNFALGSYCAMIAEMLLERNDVNPDTLDTSGRTPLSWAASYGREEIVKMLLERKDVVPDTPDKRGRTPFSWAVIYEHVEVGKALLERNGVNPDAADKSGRTPLSLAAEHWGFETMEILLRRKDVNPDRADERGRTPLSWACSHGDGEMVEMLLERNDVNHDAADDNGLTPLSWAVLYQQEEIVEILLERSSVNPATADDWGREPSPWAAEGWYGGVAEVPLKRSEVNPDAPNKGVQTLLSSAPTPRHEEIVGTLLEPNGIRPDQAPASESECEGAVDMLG